MHSQSQPKLYPGQGPAIVTIITLLFIAETFLVLVVTSIYFAEIGIFSAQVGALVQVELADVRSLALTLKAIFTGCLFVAYLFTTIGLIRVQRWAWTSAMVLMGIRLALGLGDYLFNSPAFPLLFICVLLVFLLNQREVRKAFGIIKEKRVPTELIKRAEKPIRR